MSFWISLLFIRASILEYTIWIKSNYLNGSKIPLNPREIVQRNRTDYLSTIGPDCWHGGSTTLERLRGEQSTHITSSVNSRTEQGTGYPGLDTTQLQIHVVFTFLKQTVSWWLPYTAETCSYCRFVIIKICILMDLFLLLPKINICLNSAYCPIPANWTKYICFRKHLHCECGTGRFAHHRTSVPSIYSSTACWSEGRSWSVQLPVVPGYPVLPGYTSDIGCHSRRKLRTSMPVTGLLCNAHIHKNYSSRSHNLAAQWVNCHVTICVQCGAWILQTTSLDRRCSATLCHCGCLLCITACFPYFCLLPPHYPPYPSGQIKAQLQATHVI